MIAAVKIKGVYYALYSAGVECKWKVGAGWLQLLASPAAAFCPACSTTSTFSYLPSTELHCTMHLAVYTHITTGVYYVLMPCALWHQVFCNPLIATCPLYW